jgi:hypothetical protein
MALFKCGNSFQAEILATPSVLLDSQRPRTC